MLAQEGSALREASGIETLTQPVIPSVVCPNDTAP